jgi:peroxiredoxin
MRGRIGPGERVPDAPLAWLVGDDIRTTTMIELSRGARVVVVGVPGAFTPICTRIHIPQFVEMTPSLLASGFSKVICLAGNDPWVTQLWADRLDPEGHMVFLSDGNLEFGRRCGLTRNLTDYFGGERLERCTMTVCNGLVERLNVEPTPIEITCTSAESCRLTDA